MVPRWYFDTLFSNANMHIRLSGEQVLEYLWRMPAHTNERLVRIYLERVHIHCLQSACRGLLVKSKTSLSKEKCIQALLAERKRRQLGQQAVVSKPEGSTTYNGPLSSSYKREETKTKTDITNQVKLRFRLIHILFSDKLIHIPDHSDSYFAFWKEVHAVYKNPSLLCAPIESHLFEEVDMSTINGFDTTEDTIRAWQELVQRYESLLDTNRLVYTSSFSEVSKYGNLDIQYLHERQQEKPERYRSLLLVCMVPVTQTRAGNSKSVDSQVSKKETKTNGRLVESMVRVGKEAELVESMCLAVKAAEDAGCCNPTEIAELQNLVNKYVSAFDQHVQQMKWTS